MQYSEIAREYTL